MTWDFMDQLKEVDLGGGGTAWYVYDAQGTRVRKVIENGTLKKDRIYLDEINEYYREYISGSKDYERETLHIMDDRKRLAIVETKTWDSGSAVVTPSPVIRYQFDNHLGSASLELDTSANIISYEEYHPFGTSAYRLGSSVSEVSMKRYRYVGKERDDESGLYYYGARYYAAWLCRFVSVDPLKDDYPYYTPFQYAGNKPITFIDLDGLEPAVPKNINPPAQTRIQPSVQDNLTPPKINTSSLKEVPKDGSKNGKITLNIFIIETEETGEIDDVLLKKLVKSILAKNKLSEKKYDNQLVLKESSLLDLIEVNVVKVNDFLSDEEAATYRKNGSELLYVSGDKKLNEITVSPASEEYHDIPHTYFNNFLHFGVHENLDDISKVSFEKHMGIMDAITIQEKYALLARTIIHEGIGHPMLNLNEFKVGDHRPWEFDGIVFGANIMLNPDIYNTNMKSSEIIPELDLFYKDDLDSIVEYINMY